MARNGTCPSCSARLRHDAAFCPSCGRATGVELELSDLGIDDDVAREPVTVGGERPHGLRSLVIGGGVVAALIGGAVLVSREEPPAAAPTPSTMAPAASTSGAVSSLARTTVPAYRELVLPARLSEPTAAVLYGLTVEGQLVRIEPDSGKVSIRQLELGGDVPDRTLLARSGGVVLLSPGQGSAVVQDGPAREPAELTGDFIQAFPAAGAREFWMWTGAFAIGDEIRRAVSRRDLDGDPMGAELVLPPFSQLLGDGAGGLLITSIGGTYELALETGSPSRVSDGQVVGASATALVDLRCDDRLKCRWRVTDRATGEQRLLPQPPSATTLTRFLYRHAAMSSDDRYLAYFDDTSQLSVVDLTTGEERKLGFANSGYCCSDPAWSPNGRWLFYTNVGKLLGWQAGTTNIVEVGPLSLPELATVAAGPLPAPAPG